jgi:hypothetical protein
VPGAGEAEPGAGEAEPGVGEAEPGVGEVLPGPGEVLPGVPFCPGFVAGAAPCVLPLLGEAWAGLVPV